jgi:hypothetical protein
MTIRRGLITVNPAVNPCQPLSAGHSRLAEKESSVSQFPWSIPIALKLK